MSFVSVKVEALMSLSLKESTGTAESRTVRGLPRAVTTTISSSEAWLGASAVGADVEDVSALNAGPK
jgi:hypothetical protein